MRALVLAIAALALGAPAAAQEGPAFGWAAADPLRAEFVDHFTRVLPPALLPGDALRSGAAFEVEYVGFPAEAEAAFQHAVDLWSQHVTSAVPIRVRASWAPAAEADVLGSAVPRVIANFDRRPLADLWYASALADALAGRDLDPANVDIEASFNSAFPHWYFGLDASPPGGQFDLVTVALHELGHGLGFVGSMSVDEGTGQGRWGLGSRGYPIVYDRFAERGSGTPLLDTQVYPNPSQALADALQSRDVYFDGPTAVRAQETGRPVLHAPADWVVGSSYSHLSEVRGPTGSQPYPPGNPNSLMTPTIGSAEAIHTPGPVTCGMFADMGWPLGAACAALIPDGPPGPGISDCQGALPYVCGPYPNPHATGSGATLTFAAPRDGTVRISVYDAVGRLARTLPTLSVSAGQPEHVRIDSEGLSRGVYFVRLTGPGVDAVRAMAVVR